MSPRHSQTFDAMEICPVTKLPITDKKHWKIEHPKREYTSRMAVIGSDIIFLEHLAEHDISLDYICAEAKQSLLKEMQLDKKPLYFIINLDHIVNIEFAYKSDLTNFIFNWAPNIRLMVFYNIRPEVRILIEMFQSLTPQKVRVHMTGTYEEAMQSIMAAKAGTLDVGVAENGESERYAFLKKEFLSNLARMTWMNIFSQNIHLPPEDDIFYPFFKAIVYLQDDLKAKALAEEKSTQQLLQDFENRMAQKIIALNAQVEFNKKTVRQFEQEKAAMASRSASQDMELTRISTATAEKTSALLGLCGEIIELDIAPKIKQKMTDLCKNIIETEKKEQRLSTELTIADSQFLSKLQKKHPNLNQRELRIGLMIKLDYDTREIARSSGISTRGLESIRYRIHKKLGLDKHKSIKTYLTELASTE